MKRILVFIGLVLFAWIGLIVAEAWRRSRRIYV